VTFQFDVKSVSFLFYHGSKALFYILALVFPMLHAVALAPGRRLFFPFFWITRRLLSEYVSPRRGPSWEVLAGIPRFASCDLHREIF